MLKHLLPLLLMLPGLAFAECGFERSGNTMTIVVGKNGEKCLSSDGFRKAFKSDVAEALDEGETQGPAKSPQKKSIDDRSANGRKLWTIAERQHQATKSGGRYLGQQR